MEANMITQKVSRMEGEEEDKIAPQIFKSQLARGGTIKETKETIRFLKHFQL
jgi:hypothetical protein